MQNKVLKLLLFLVLPAQIVVAQVNTEALRKQDAAEGWSANFSFDMAYNAGNSEYLKLKAGSRIDVKFTPFSAFLVGNYQRGLEANELFINKAFVHGRLMRSVFSNQQVEVFLQKEFNDFIKLKDRELVGGGLRFQLVNQDSAKQSIVAYLGVGIMWEHESLDLETSVQDKNQFRSTNYLSIRWRIDERLRFLVIGYFQPSLESSSDYRLLSESTLAFNLTKQVVFRTSVNYRRDNEPPAGVKSYDLELSNGISVLF